MTKAEYEKKRIDLLEECNNVTDGLYQKAVNEGRAGLGLGSDLPEIKEVKEKFRRKATELKRKYELKEA